MADGAAGAAPVRGGGVDINAVMASTVPAVLLVGGGGVLLRLAAQPRLRVAAAAAEAVDQPAGVLIGVALLTVVAGLLLSAGAFGTIRLLEGYWGSGWPGTLLARWGIGWQQRRHARLYARRERWEARAKAAAVEEMHCIDLDQVQIGEIVDAGMWMLYAPPSTTGPWERARAAVEEYPEDHRLLATRLGNVLRATEDRLPRTGSDREGQVLRRGEVPARQRAQHDRHRARLDLHCCNTLVFAVLTAAAVPVVVCAPAAPIAAAVLVVAVPALLAVASYRAAIAHARGYTTVLRAMHEGTR